MGFPREEHVLQVFQAIADRYDWMNGIMSLGLHQTWRRQAVERLGVKPGAAVLDVCCGTGDLTLLLRERAGACGRVVGLDFSPLMLQQARAKCRRRQVSGVELQLGDALNLPFSDECFDYVAMAFALRNLKDRRRALQEMQRVLVPGGRLLLLDISHPPNPLLRHLLYFYLRRLLPRLAGALTGRHAEYTWLPESLQGFPDSRALQKLLAELGLQQAQVQLLLGGVAAIHTGGKPAAPGS